MEGEDWWGDIVREQAQRTMSQFDCLPEAVRAVIIRTDVEVDCRELAELWRHGISTQQLVELIQRRIREWGR